MRRERLWTAVTLDALSIVVLVCAVAMWAKSERVAIRILVVVALFQSAAAAKFGSFGIIPSHLLLAIPAYRCLSDPSRRQSVMALLRFPEDGFWLLLICLYSLLSAYFNPRLMAGITAINPIGTTAYEPSLSGVPLGPTSGNMTQVLYMMGSTLAYLVIAEHVGRKGRLVDFSQTFSCYCVLNIALAWVDVAGSAAGLGDLLSIVHNGNYALHLDEVESGLKRIAGAFSEAAAFATATLGGLAFTFRLCLGNVDVRRNMALTVAQVVLLILSTSTTAYGGLAVLVTSLYAWACICSLTRSANPYTLAATVFLPLTVIVASLAVLMDQAAHDTVAGLLDDIVFNKSVSSSALERGAMNRQAVANFLDTSGLGAGAGSVRASSFPLAVLANLGVPGAVPYAIFLARILLRDSEHRPNSVEWHVQVACRWGAFGILIAAVFSGTLVDLGIVFFILSAAGSTQRPPGPGRRVTVASLSPERRSVVPTMPCDGSEGPATNPAWAGGVDDSAGRRRVGGRARGF